MKTLEKKRIKQYIDESNYGFTKDFLFGECTKNPFVNTITLTDEQIEVLKRAVADDEIERTELNRLLNSSILVQVKKDKLIEWYLEDTYNSESEEIRNDLANEVVAGIQNNGSFTITADEIVSRINLGAIPMYLIEGGNEDDSTELADFYERYEVIII